MGELTLALLSGVISGALVAVFTAVFNRHYEKANSKDDAEAEERKKEAWLMRNLLFAIAKLAYACTMAIKRGAPNGEIEVGVAAYEEAMKSYRDFEREKMAEISGG